MRGAFGASFLLLCFGLASSFGDFRASSGLRIGFLVAASQAEGMELSRAHGLEGLWLSMCMFPSLNRQRLPRLIAIIFHNVDELHFKLAVRWKEVKVTGSCLEFCNELCDEAAKAVANGLSVRRLATQSIDQFAGL
eukprot:CAMPEP_0181413548 /NCGR_PEP_ID=MMETSP1110-20121109/9031_1 /TAXON_ID=174948 /ORGANISM="Symbiodinium sp., Strain CCMP421" /LENGTH=135 /DNA_ID=CAMNT_0023536369 /DNA_START=102 /DNA_END=509 /DNA_ORIENTATION=+